MLEVNGFWSVLLLGIFGGFLAEGVRWYKIRESPNLPTYSKSPLYWIITLIMVLIGGGLAALYGTINVNAILAVNIGASAPLIILSLVSTTPLTPQPPATQPPASKPQMAQILIEPKQRKRDLIKDFLGGR